MNATSIPHFAPTASVEGAKGQGFDEIENAPGVIEMLEIVRGASPELVTVTGKVALAFIGWFANAAVVLESVMFGFRSTSLIRLFNKSPTYIFP